MNIKFNVDLEESMFKVIASYSREEIVKPQFLLNRDFIVEELICNSNNLDIEKVMNRVEIEDYDGYIVNQYTLPEDIESLTIKYRGTLDGTTGSCPYVRETINKNFTFIRSETFCYPIFALNKFPDISNFNRSIMLGEIDIIVPEGYSVLSPSKLLSTESIEDKSIYKFDGSDMNFSIAKYERLQLPVGDFYLLNNATEETKEMITSTLTETYNFMNETFGQRVITSNVKYAAIPSRYGSFARPTCVFIDEDTFQSKIKMSNIIHEFIHLGWNAITDCKTQRIRFFDEAFTNYFTLRVLEHILGYEHYTKMIESYKKWHREEFREKLIPISDYGKYECGDFSYSIGALCINELCNLVGRETFDNATRIFLEKYKETPVSLEGFCEEYMTLCNNPNLKAFFEEWIYTTKGPEKLLNI